MIKAEYRNRILFFLVLTTVFSLLGLYVPDWFGMDPNAITTPFVKLLLYSWGPGLAVLVMRRGMEGRSMERYGWSRKHMTFRWWFTAMFLPFFVIMGILGLTFVLGNVFHLPGFGQVVLGDSAFGHELSLWFSPYWEMLQNNIMMPNEYWVLVVLILVFGTILGATTNLFFNLGEELGWRGFMVREMRQYGFIGSNFVIGGLQGLWTLPLIFHFLPDVGDQLFQSIFVMVGYSVSVAFVLAYLSLKSKSVYTSAIFSGVMNNIGAVTFFFIWGEDPLIGSAKGLIGMFVMLGITFLILRLDPEFVANYQKLSYGDADDPEETVNERPDLSEDASEAEEEE